MIRQLKGIGLLALGLVVLAGPAFAQGIIYDSNILFGNNGGGTQFDTDVGSGGDTEAFVTSNFSRNLIGVDPLLESTYNSIEGPWRPTASSPAVFGNAGAITLLKPSDLDPFFDDVPYAGALSADPDQDWTRGWLYTNTDGGLGRDDIDFGLPVVTVSGNVPPGTTWTADNRYELVGRVTVPDGVTLVIEPGVVVTGSPGTNAYLAVDRGGRIQAVGTAQEPIIFTSGAPLGSQAPGDWSGVLINGRAVANCDIDPSASVDCRATNDPAGPFSCESEGNGGLFGGTNDEDDSGILRFVRSEYAGLEVSPNNELNAFTFNGVGRGTTLEFLQTFRSTDDHFEWFGGAVRSRWFVALEGDDDGLDWQLGYRGRHQYAIVTALSDQNEGGANPTGANPEKGMECDNNEDDNECPSESDGIVANVTLIGGSTQRGDSSTGTNFRRGTNGGVVNSIIVDFDGVAFDMDGAATFANGVRSTIPADFQPVDPTAGGITFDGNFLWNNNGGGTQYDTDAGSGGNTEDFVTSNFVNNSIQDPRLDPNYIVIDDGGNWNLQSDSPALFRNGASLLRVSDVDPFFEDRQHAGALSDGAAAWTQGWIYADLDGGATRTDINPSLPVITVSGNVAPGTTWTADNRYELVGRVTVPDGVTLTIDPGVVVTGSPGTNAYLAVDRGGRIDAQGTADQPIIFTSGAPLGSQAPGDWSGVLINGRAVANCDIDPSAAVDCRATNDPAGPFSCESEGNGGLFGGTDDADDSGILRYVRSEYAGLEISPNNELNAFTFNAVGTGTTVEYLQTFRSTDDHFEWFGGAVKSRYFIALEGDDDGLDWQLGYRGRHQFAVVTALGLGGANPEKGMECDNNEDDNECPSESNGIVANLTLIGGSQGRGTSSTGINFRRGTNGGVFNSIIVDFAGVAFDMDSAATFANGVGPRPALQSVGTVTTGIEGGISNSAFNVSFAPNPVQAGNGMFRFTLPKSSDVQVRVFNARGRLVDTVFSGRLDAGTRELSWTPRNQANGVYFYQVQAGGQVASGKLMLVN